MIRHCMDVIKTAVDILNPSEIPVITVDQPLWAYTLSKQIQWRWPETHGKDHFVIFFGRLHIEIAVGLLKTLGDILDASRWTGAVVLAGVATIGTADSFPKAAHVTRTRHITASSLYLPLQEAYNQYTSGLDKGQDLMLPEDWCAERVDSSPQFQFWFIILQLELVIFIYVRSVREGNFLLYIDTPSKIVTCFFLHRIYTLCQMDPSSPARNVDTGNQASKCIRTVSGWKLHYKEDNTCILYCSYWPGPRPK